MREVASKTEATERASNELKDLQGNKSLGARIGDWLTGKQAKVADVVADLAAQPHSQDFNVG